MYIEKKKLKPGLKPAKDHELLPCERETYFRHDGESGQYLIVDTSEKKFIELYLYADDFELTRYTTKKGQENKVFHLSGKLPISCFRFKNESVDSMNYLSRVMQG